MTKDRIDLAGFTIILVLTLLWGVNYFAIKVTTDSLSPVFTSLLRSIIASVLGIGYCLAVKQPLFHRDIRLFHGLMVGLLFGAEFVCLYLGMLYTNAARAAVFLYLSPFVVAVGAHLFLGERLNAIKSVSLVLAFFGLYLVFMGKPALHAKSMLLGDVLEIVAAVFWGATTLYIKRYLAQTVHPINTFVYQLVFSIPIMLVAAFFIEPVWVKGDLSGGIILSLFYQSVIVAFVSYLVWFKLIHVYPVASLSVFTFLTPIFGVASGVIFLNEDLTKGLVIGLICVCIGIYGTNYRKSERPAARAT
ncbi:MAG: putative amino-acid metabolite efflux pump [Syntrophorhabdaceae bacterium PtaU1.Bin034]|jgi:drug/metabolite transporter (DMT)-like permease|nr:MAG: putative amino-acid metabolite efflux pump [Syntrophorhabdaceae bacterium PtaU1.Bin034]